MASTEAIKLTRFYFIPSFTARWLFCNGGGGRYYQKLIRSSSQYLGDESIFLSCMSGFDRLVKMRKVRKFGDENRKMGGGGVDNDLLYM